jgi:hypothetical protein
VLGAVGLRVGQIAAVASVDEVDRARRSRRRITDDKRAKAGARKRGTELAAYAISGVGDEPLTFATVRVVPT